MKGVILAGGFGTRLRPMTFIINKHLLPVYDQPMICYAINTLKRSGVKEIMVVTERASVKDFKKFLGSGKDFDVNLYYQEQKGAGGIADALRLTNDFANREPMAVILGDNVFSENFKGQIDNFKKGATVFLKKISGGLERFGVPVFKNKKIIFIEEKPQSPKSSYAATGLYLLDSHVFDIIKRIQPSRRGELEITDVINEYLKEELLQYEFIKGYWSDVGTFDSLLETSLWLAKQKKPNKNTNGSEK